MQVAQIIAHLYYLQHEVTIQTYNTPNAKVAEHPNVIKC